MHRPLLFLLSLSFDYYLYLFGMLIRCAVTFLFSLPCCWSVLLLLLPHLSHS